MYYLTGYDSFGFVYFQCLFLSADGPEELRQILQEHGCWRASEPTARWIEIERFVPIEQIDAILPRRIRQPFLYAAIALRRRRGVG